ncbi:MAG: hypothetical protein LBN33_10625 [Desulfovibrio sp.]|jgi:Flp pilus assembly protein TadD|nr:hypothetical protein [Desulfovibrio sp.]
MSLNKRFGQYFILLPLLLALAAMCAVSAKDLADEKNPRTQTKGMMAQRDMPEQGANGPKGPELLTGTLDDAEAGEISALMSSLRENPNDADTLGKIAELFIRAEDWPRAEVFLIRAILGRPADARYRQLLGLAMFRQGKLEGATKNLEEALELQTDNFTLYNTLYNLIVIYKHHLKDTNKTKEFQEKLKSLLERDPELREKTPKEMP